VGKPRLRIWGPSAKTSIVRTVVVTCTLAPCQTLLKPRGRRSQTRISDSFCNCRSEAKLACWKPFVCPCTLLRHRGSYEMAHCRNCVSLAACLSTDTNSNRTYKLPAATRKSERHLLCITSPYPTTPYSLRPSVQSSLHIPSHLEV
jgi:hypothetical protein